MKATIAKLIETLFKSDQKKMKSLGSGTTEICEHYVIESFGEDCRVPQSYKIITIPTQERGKGITIGVINKKSDSGLNFGDKKIYSTTPEGDEIKSYILLNADGTIQLNANTSSSTIELNEDDSITIENDLSTILINSDGTINITANNNESHIEIGEDGNITIENQDATLKLTASGNININGEGDFAVRYNEMAKKFNETKMTLNEQISKYNGLLTSLTGLATALSTAPQVPLLPGVLATALTTALAPNTPANPNTTDPSSAKVENVTLPS